MRRFNICMLALCSALALSIGGMLIAAPNLAQSVVADEERIVDGAIKSVDTERNRFVLAVGEDGEETSLRYNKRTQFTLDGEESSAEAALREGNHANVRHRNSMAIRVDATTKSSVISTIWVDDEETTHGAVKNVDTERNRFVLTVGEEGEEISLRYNERTQFTLDGEESSAEAALKEGHQANVRHRSNVAIRVDATTRTQ